MIDSLYARGKGGVPCSSRRALRYGRRVRQAQELGKTTMKTLIGIVAVVVIAAAPSVASAAAKAKQTAHMHHHHHHHAKKVAKVEYGSPMGHLLHDMFK